VALWRIFYAAIEDVKMRTVMEEWTSLASSDGCNTVVGTSIMIGRDG